MHGHMSVDGYDVYLRADPSTGMNRSQAFLGTAGMESALASHDPNVGLLLQCSGDAYGIAVLWARPLDTSAQGDVRVQWSFDGGDPVRQLWQPFADGTGTLVSNLPGELQRFLARLDSSHSLTVRARSELGVVAEATFRYEPGAATKALDAMGCAPPSR